MEEQGLQTIYLKDYEAPTHEVKTVHLEVTLGEESTIVVNTSSWASKNSETSLMLHGDSLELVSVHVNGKEHSSYKEYGDNLELTQLPNEFDLQITTKIYPEKNTALMGLYSSNGMYCTQCEAEGFRRITYHLDRPDVMSLFTTKIVADRAKYPVLLSNGNLIDKGLLDDNLHFATWEDPFKKPCYLFAMVAGDLVCAEDTFLTASKKLVALKLYVERENLEKTAHALAALKKSMVWDEQKYDREYDLDSYMIVATNDFNMGAMENKGLNIFNSKYVLADPQTATDKDYAGIDRVIGHEYFHNWSGNRVTCRDWFQLSLKEGFTVYREQQFVEDITESPVSRIEQVQNLRISQFAEDSGPMAHPVRPESFVEINNFYTMTIYEKGSEVIRMMATLLGPEVFKKACNKYFSKFDGMAVTTDDFAATMEEVSGIDLSQFKLWYSQAGTPKLTVNTNYDSDNKKYTITVEQSVPDTPDMSNKKPMHIPFAVGLLDRNGNETAKTELFDVRKDRETFTFEDVEESPVPSLLRNFSAPVYVDYSYSEEELLLLMEHDTDDFNRWDSGQNLYSSIIKRATENVSEADEILSNSRLYEGVRGILSNGTLAPSLKAHMLHVPSLEELMNKISPVEPNQLMQVRRKLIQRLAKSNIDHIESIYERTSNILGRYSYNNQDAESRCLKNTMLSLLTQTGDDKFIELAVKQYEASDNMTDQYAALAAINNIDSNMRKECLEKFYERWSHVPLVVNKWLVLEASSELDNTFSRVVDIKNSERFKISNPNMVYSLVGGFCSGNAGQFHNGTVAYDFLEEMIVTLDKMNPQVAARMTRPFTKFKRYSESIQKQLLERLERLAKNKLSTDVGEIVAKSLKSA